MAASSFLLPSLSHSIPSKLQILASPSPSSSHANTVFFPSFTAFPGLRKAHSLALKVAFASDVEQEDEEVDERRFSEDLKLFVGNLPFSVDSAKLAGLFGRVGNVEMVEVIYDKQTGKSRGFGFVTMSTVDEVEAAAQQFNGYALEGRPMRVNSGPKPRRDEFSSNGFRSGGNSGAGNRIYGFEGRSSRGNSGPRSRRDDFPSKGFISGGNARPDNRVYVGNLSWGVDNEALETLFSEQGNVVDARVIYDKESGRSKGFGFVTYNSAEEVDNAIASLNGMDLDGRSIRVTVAETRPARFQF